VDEVLEAGLKSINILGWLLSVVRLATFEKLNGWLRLSGG
jgi:hypothetical protein